jgi:hypothetical protein
MPAQNLILIDSKQSCHQEIKEENMVKTKFVIRLAFAAVLALACTASAQETNIVESGETTVALSSGFLNALQSLGVAPGVIAPTQLTSTTVNFPINGGAIDLKTAIGNIGHTGGLTLSAGGTVISIENFTIDTTGKSPIITGLVVANGPLVGRITLFDLALPGSFKLPLAQYRSVLVDLQGVTVTLDGAAANALNQAFNTSAFKAGFGIGTARVRAFTDGWVPRS